jgi:dUTP pyrophosphatase
MYSETIQTFKVKKLNEKAILPKKGSERAAGYDLYSCEDTMVPAKSRKLVKLGIAVAVPSGNYGRIAPRSGLALKNFIDVGAGVIDEDYRGECIVIFKLYLYLSGCIALQFL